MVLCCGSLVQGNPVPDAQWIYKTVGETELKMDVFLPDGYDASKEKFPAIVIFHGGSWRTGTPDMHYPDCAYWSRRGMIAVSVDYRLKERDHIDVPLECVKDAKSAFRFLRKNAAALKVDTEKMVSAGGSAGGQLAAAAAMAEDVNDDAYDLSIPVRPAAVIMYNPWFKCEDRLSPPKRIREGLPPMITFIGTEDKGIPVQQMIDWHEALKEAGVESELHIGEGGGHGFTNGRNPRNRFFYWSLELEDAFLVKHGILSGTHQVVRPEKVLPLDSAEFSAHY